MLKRLFNHCLMVSQYKKIQCSTHKYYIVTFILLFSHCIGISQDCIVYPEIDGDPCIFCVPDGWSPINSPDIGNPAGGPSACIVNIGLSGPSPSGNNFVSICTNNANYTEGMSTIINNLTPCQSYTFGIWWEETIWCNVWTIPGSLLITVQGEEFIFSDAPVWELAQVCFTAQSTSVEISVTVLADGGQHCLVVDGSPACSELSPCTAPQPCCSLEVTADDAHEICPGGSINLNALAQMPTGNLQVEWTSVPANGVTFLSDPNILNPTFTFPSGDFEGETFNFLLTVTDDLCTKTKEVEVKVLKSEMSTFDFSVCELADPSIFPTESLNGYEGTWTGNFDFNALAGIIETYTFTLAANEVNCIREVDVDVEIIEAQDVSFDLATSFCSNDEELQNLPSVSQDLINGTWNINEFTPSVLGVGIFDFQFTPESQFCALPYTHSISINLKPNFDTLMCASNEAIVINQLSNNGILGLWNPGVINPNDIINNEFVSIWNPVDPLSSCVAEIPVTFTFQNPAPLTFTLVDSLCLNTGIYNLPTTSIEGIGGQWNIPNINTNTLPAGTINVTFASTEFCKEEFQADIKLKEEKTPLFDIENEFCKTAAAFALPTTSLDGITGTWSIPIIDPSIISTGFTSTFTPNGSNQLCYLPVNVVFQISSTIIPVFDLPITVCKTEAPLIFPTISKNGILGTWTSETIDFSSINTGFVKNIFIPNNAGCEESIEITIAILNLDKPSVSKNDPSDCGTNDGSIILSGSIEQKEFSLDGLTWQSDTLFDGLGSGRYVVYQRSNLNTVCWDSMEVNLTSPNSPNLLKIEATDVTSCKVNNGKIICSAEGENVEYSIDGLTWQTSPIFENLAADNYTLQVRNSAKVNCITQSPFVIDAVEKTLLVDVKALAVTDCGKDDGKVFITAVGENIAYSINGGQDYFSTSTFNNLKAGEYNVIVQSTSNTDCNVDTIITIASPTLPSDLLVIATDVSACDKEDGRIAISAKGNSLEYSVDGGLTWSIESVFSALSANAYTIVVREKDAVNCNLIETIKINAPDAPTLTNTTIAQPTTCISNDGVIKLELNASNVEYSINGGINWQTSNEFNNLSEGSYTIVFRPINAILCDGEVTLEIKNPPCPCNDLSIDIDATKVNCKNAFSGQIDINNIDGTFTSENVNLMWENGSSNSSLSNLAEGWYTYTIVYDKNCKHVDSIFVGSFDPIEFGLLGYDVSCNDLGSIEVYDFMGGSGQFQFSKDALSFQENTTFFNLTADEYAIMVKDILGCNESKSIAIGTEKNLDLTLEQIKPITKGTSIVLNPLINQTTIDSFTWSPTTYILNPGNLIAEVAPPTTTEYQLTIYFGTCSETRSITVEVVANDKLYIPNIISFNSTSNNNRFYFLGNADNNIDIDYYKFYDRWGNLVKQINNPEINNAQDGWDGTLNGKNVEQGVYIYYSELKINGQKKKITGSLSVVR